MLKRPRYITGELVFPKDVIPYLGKVLERYLYVQYILYARMEILVGYEALLKKPGGSGVKEKRANLFRIEMEKVRQLFCRYVVVKSDQRVAQIEDYGLIPLIDYRILLIWTDSSRDNTSSAYSSSCSAVRTSRCFRPRSPLGSAL